MLLCFFFFSSRRRHTRCSRDWSSDVCSSDLKNANADPASSVSFTRLDSLAANDPNRFVSSIYVDPANANHAWISYTRSEERRVGKECRYRWARYHEKKRRESTNKRS